MPNRPGFFFQAEDGIRDVAVTGVQTCALPILFEIFFDGANGGDGYYGGAYERREIDNRTYYDWPNTWQIVRDLQPTTVLFSDAGPDIRWVGNENGIAGETCWATSNRGDFSPGNADVARLNRGDRPGDRKSTRLNQSRLHLVCRLLLEKKKKVPMRN